MRKGIIFDIDGTLWDSSIQVTEAWNVIMKKHSLPLLTVEDVSSSMGLSMDNIARRIFPQWMKDEDKLSLMDECASYENEYLLSHPGTLYPNVIETLKELKGRGYILCIVTNAQKGYAEAMIESSGLSPYISSFLSWGDTKLSKGENIRLMIEKERLDSATYVGDTQGDYVASKGAGIPFIFASYGLGKVEGDVPSIKGIEDLVGMV